MSNGVKAIGYGLWAMGYGLWAVPRVEDLRPARGTFVVYIQPIANSLYFTSRPIACTSPPLTSRCFPMSGGVPVTMPLTSSNSTTGLGLSTFM
jgi:hypothetical protein